jgi:hypothetical protein
VSSEATCTTVELARHDERIVAISREINQERAYRAKEIEIAKVELERRLDVLNHAHARAQELQATFLPRETYEANRKELENRLNKAEGEVREIAGRLITQAAVAAALVSLVVAVVLRFALK